MSPVNGMFVNPSSAQRARRRPRCRRGRRRSAPRARPVAVVHQREEIAAHAAQVRTRHRERPRSRRSRRRPRCRPVAASTRRPIEARWSTEATIPCGAWRVADCIAGEVTVGPACPLLASSRVSTRRSTAPTPSCSPSASGPSRCSTPTRRSTDTTSPTAICLGTLDGRPCFAVAVDTDDHAGATPLMGLWGQVDETMWTIAGRAVQLVEWERTHRFCGRCGTPTEPLAGRAGPPLSRRAGCSRSRGWRPRSSSWSSATTDGRCSHVGARSPSRCTAASPASSSPGETLEDAVHREVFEEVGIEIDDVRYWASQPWPFPHSLMLGFNARYASGELVLDESEIVDAQWYAPRRPAADPARDEHRPPAHRRLGRRVAADDRRAAVDRRDRPTC